MKKSGSLIYAFAVYAGISVLFITAQFLFAVALIFLLSHVMSLLLGSSGMRVAVSYDSSGFAFLTTTNTVLQYYLSSLLAHNLGARPALFGIICFSSAISSAFFLRLAAHSSLSIYVFAFMPLIFSYLLGSVMGLLQKAAENPFHGSKLNIFRID
jgi:hypothetical protein